MLQFSACSVFCFRIRFIINKYPYILSYYMNMNKYCSDLFSSNNCSEYFSNKLITSVVECQVKFN